MTQDDWKFINTFAPWFSAVGTISAVVISLYLARKDKPKLKVKNSIQIVISEAIEGHPRYLVIEATNIGIRPVKIVSVGWTIGLFKKRSFIQILSKDITDQLANLYSSELPITLEDGEEAKWLISLDKENNWIKSFKKHLSWFPIWDLFFTNLEVYTSHGLKYKVRIGKSVRDELLKSSK